MDRSRDLPVEDTSVATATSSPTTKHPRVRKALRTELDHPRWNGGKPPAPGAWSRQKKQAIRDKHAFVTAKKRGEVPATIDCMNAPDYLRLVVDGKLHPYPLEQRVGACRRDKLPDDAKWRLTARHVDVLAHVVTAHLVVGTLGFLVDHPTIGKLVGCSPRTAGSRMRDLCAWGLVTKLPCYLPGGLGSWRARDLYRVTELAKLVFAIGRRRGPKRAPAIAQEEAVPESRERVDSAGKNCQAELSGPTVRIEKVSTDKRSTFVGSGAGASPVPSSTRVKARTAAAVPEDGSKEPASPGPRAHANAHAEMQLALLRAEVRSVAARAALAAASPPSLVTPPAATSEPPIADVELAPGRGQLPTVDELRRDEHLDDPWVVEQRKRDAERREKLREKLRDPDRDLADVLEGALRSHARGGELRPVDVQNLQRIRRGEPPPRGRGGAS